MEGYGWVIFGGAVVFFGALFVYLMFMIFLPEWVGITGKTALMAEASHRADTPLTTSPLEFGAYDSKRELAVEAADPSGMLVGSEMAALDIEAEAVSGATLNPNQAVQASPREPSSDS